MQHNELTPSPLLGRWRDRFGGRRPTSDMEISGPIVEEDDFERHRRHVQDVSHSVTHVLVIRPFGPIGITATQLELRPGDVVEVLERYPVGYWRGRLGDKEGIFDADCCVPCTPEGLPLAPLALDGREIAVVDDAETSDSQGDDAAYSSLPVGVPGNKPHLRQVVLRKALSVSSIALEDRVTAQSPSHLTAATNASGSLPNSAANGGSNSNVATETPEAEGGIESTGSSNVGKAVTAEEVLGASSSSMASAAGSTTSGKKGTPEKAPAHAREEEDSQDSVSVSIDPNLLDSIGESPRGVMRMLTAHGSRRGTPSSTSPNTRGSSRIQDELVSPRRSSEDEHRSRVTESRRLSQQNLVQQYNMQPDQKLPPQLSTDNAVIRLNIGGKRFTTTLFTLRKFPDSMLAVMFSGRFGTPMLDSDGAYFIDRDGTNFRYILNFLRDGTVVLPDDTRKRKEILKEAIYFQLPQLVKDILRSGSKAGVAEFLTVRYLPGATYDGWPIRIEGHLRPEVVRELNGDESMPPEKETDAGVKNMFGRFPVWKMRGVFLTSIFNILSAGGWKMVTSNGSGAGVEPKITFAELYVFSRQVFPKHEIVHTATQKLV